MNRSHRHNHSLLFNPSKLEKKKVLVRADNFGIYQMCNKKCRYNSIWILAAKTNISGTDRFGLVVIFVAVDAGWVKSEMYTVVIFPLCFISISIYMYEKAYVSFIHALSPTAFYPGFQKELSQTPFGQLYLV